MDALRIVTFNLENLDDKAKQRPPLSTRIALMRPQLLRTSADLFCFQEVNSLGALDQLLADTPFAGYARVSTTDAMGRPLPVRNLVVASRLPILKHEQLLHELAPAPLYRKVTAIPPETEATEVRWERPLLHVQLDAGGGRVLHVLNLHLKSKLPTDVAGQRLKPGDAFSPWRSASGAAEGAFLSSMKRVGQALEARMLVDTIFDADENALLAVCGDLNAESDEVPVTALRGDVEDTENGALATRVLVACERSVAEPARFSLIHRGRGQMIDHILASRALVRFYRHTEVHNELLHDESAAFATDEKFPESDHAPVIAEFALT